MSAFHRGYRTFAVHHEKSLVPAFFKVSISDHLFVNLESGKIKYCFGKSLEKVLKFGSKNLYEHYILLHFFLLASPMLHQVENMGGRGHQQYYTKVSY